MMIFLACLFLVAVAIGSYVALAVAETLRGPDQGPHPHPWPPVAAPSPPPPSPARPPPRTFLGPSPGEPASNGGWGSYPIPSCIACAPSAPAGRSARTSAMSIPAETPAAVMILP